MARRNQLRNQANTLLFLLVALPASAAAQTNEPVKRFDNSVVSLPLPDGPSPAAVEPLDSQTQQSKLQLHFGLATPNLDDLQARVAKGEIIDAKELSTKYAGSAESSTKLTKWLKDQCYTGISTTSDNTSVYATGSVALIEKSLGVTMKKVTVNGNVQPSATSVPALPRDIGDAVTAIDGLQPWIRAVKHAVPSPGNKGPIPRPAAVGSPATYKVADILKAYNASGLRRLINSASGRGQTIAILIDTLPKISDVDLFLTKSGIPKSGSRLKLIDVQRKGAALPLREGEETLDIEWAAGIAPGANIRVYAVGSLRFTDLDKALDMVFTDAQSADARDIYRSV